MQAHLDHQTEAVAARESLPGKALRRDSPTDTIRASSVWPAADTARPVRANLRSSRTLPWSVIALLLLAAALLALTACGSDAFANAEEDMSLDGASDTSSEAAFDLAEDVDVEELSAEGGPDQNEVEVASEGGSEADGELAGPLGAGTSGVIPTAADIGRQLIFTASLTVGVDDVTVAGAQATSIIQGVDGFVFGQDTVGGTEPRSTLIFKVRPEDFDEALRQLGTVGELRDQQVSTDDVTERVVDLQSRIEVAELGVARLRAALETAGNLEDYAELERLLLDRESELEVQRGMLRTLEDQVALATITLTLTQERVANAIELSVSHYEGFDEGRSCPGIDLYSVEQRSEVTVCFEVTNTGDQTLSDVVLVDTVLGLDTSSDAGPTPIVVFGSLEELPPGQVVMLAIETDVERDLNLRTRATAVPAGGAAEATGPAVVSQAQYLLGTTVRTDPPGFGDGFETGAVILRGLWVGARWLLGLLVPLLPVLVPFAAVVLWVRRRRAARRRLAVATELSDGSDGPSRGGDDLSEVSTPTVEA